MCANNVEVDHHDRLTGGGIVEVPLKDKASVVKRIQEDLGIPQGATAAVGDTQVDVSMFRRARVSIAFNPLDEQTEEAASHVVRSRDLRSILPILLLGDGT